MKRFLMSILVLQLLIFSMCRDGGNQESKGGPLVIIGGGDKPDVVMNAMVDLAGIRDDGYMFVLPMASGVPDSALLWAKEDFSGTGLSKIPGYYFKKGEIPPADKIDSLRNAKLIFISGGDQSRFMDAVKNTAIIDAIREAHSNGAVIAGTSAGAAVMSLKMITGNQLKHPDEEGGFTTIEKENIEIAEGLGLLKDVIIDQHFIKRQRINRLIAASAENPDQLCVGIDESTAIIVKGDNASVIGVGQVVVIKNRRGTAVAKEGLLGIKGLEVSLYLTGDNFRIR